MKTFFFWRALALVSLALASSIPVLGLESVCPRKGCPWPRIFFVSLALASSLVSSTPPLVVINQRWSRGHKARGQGKGHKKIRGQGQGPRTQAQVFPPKKKVFKIFFQAISPPPKKKGSSKRFFRRSSIKNVFQNFFSGDLQNFNNLKKIAVLEPRTGQFSRT